MARRRVRAKRKSVRRQKSYPLALLAGLGLGTYGAYRQYRFERKFAEPKMPIGPAALAAVTGIRVVPGWTSEQIAADFHKWGAARLLNTWGPIAAGLIAHEILGNSKGAFGTGLGLKLNRKLPGRIKI